MSWSPYKQRGGRAPKAKRYRLSPGAVVCGYYECEWSYVGGTEAEQLVELRAHSKVCRFR